MHRRDIIGTAVSITDYDAVLDAVDAAIATDRRIYICCTPASSLVFARDDAQLASALADAEIVTPDGMGVVLAARLLGESISDRVYGPDLMQAQLARGQSDGTAIFLYGGHDQATLDRLTANLTESFPKLRIAGSWLPPHRALTASESTEVVKAINDSGAQIVWVGLGSPKQEIWMQQMRGQLAAPVLVGVGAAFDFFAGRVEQAPSAMQRLGLEWLYRIFQDPSRMLRRYLTTLPRFAALALVQALRERRGA